jgi:glycosyltransferase A (GT-A) superfamily protein (DUF2064 family)
MQNAIVIFTKVPKVGDTKTRLTEERGGILTPEEARDLYQAFLLDVIDACTAADCSDVYICYNRDGDRDYLQELIMQTARPHLVKDIFADEGKTFDYGMQYAADYVLRNGSQDRLADSVMILGGDIPCLQPATIREAFRKLDLLASSPAAYACAVCKEGNPPIGGAIVESADQEAGFNIIAFTCTTPFDFNGVFYNPYGITALDMIARKAAEHKIPISLVDMLPDIDLPVDLASLIPVVKTLQLAEKFDSTLVAPQRTIRILESLGFETVAGPQ